MPAINGTPFDDNNTFNNGANRPAVIGTDGNDEIFGLDGNDILEGKAGNDFLKGGRGADTMIGGAGNDTLEWDDGEGSDVMSGGEGHDVVLVNTAANLADNFVLRQIDGNKAFFERLSRPFTLTVDTAETFVVNGQNGDDSFIVKDLSQTGVQLIDFRGGEGNDTLNASETSTRIVATGDAGNDLMIGGSAADSLSGGDGDDTIVGGRGNDTMIGGTGNDRLVWNNGDGSDTISGGSGYDVVEVNDARGAGDDLVLGKGSDGKAVFDRVNLVPFKLTVDTAEKFEVNNSGGDDRLKVNNLAHTGVKLVEFRGGEGQDTLDGSATATALIGFGDAGDDRLLGGSNNDVLGGGDNNDYLSGGDGYDVLSGGKGDDQLYGGDGWDILDGGDNNDYLDGGRGNDFLTGGTGDDRLIGGEDADILNGGIGKDTLTGGAGRDLFFFNAPTEGVDTITDFVVSQDLIVLSATGFGLPSNGLLTPLTAGQFRLGSSAQSATDRLIYVSNTGALYFDADGTGAIAQVQIAQLSTNLNLTSNNFFLIG